jgi:hypothetical protein
MCHIEKGDDVSQQIENAGTKAKAWAEHLLLAPSLMVKKAEELDEFSERFSSLFEPGASLDMNTKKKMESFLGYDFQKVQLHCGTNVEEVSSHLNARAFTFGEHIYAPQRNINSTTAEGWGLLAHELTHVVQQTRPQELSQDGLINNIPNPGRGTKPDTNSKSQMAFLAPTAQKTTNPSLGEEQAQANEQLATQVYFGNGSRSPPEISYVTVADKVYRMMQHDLLLERERATKVGA